MGAVKKRVHKNVDRIVSTGHNVGMSATATAGGFGRSRFHAGLHPGELWGVSRGAKGERKRGESSRARRRAKKAAQRQGVRLKRFLRKGQQS